MNLAQILSEAASGNPEQVAVKLDDFALNYGLLEQAAMRIAAMLAQRGIGPGDRVALMLPNVPHFVVAYYGILRAGAVVVPMNVLNKRREVEYYLRDSGAKLLFVWNDFAAEAEPAAAELGCECIAIVPGEFEQTLFGTEPLEQLIERQSDDTAVLLYTSGTTGTPKGAELTHDNLLRNCHVSRDLFDLGTGTVVLGALPLFHSFGQTCAMNTCVVASGMLTLLPRFDPVKALEIIERDQVAVFEGVPSMYGANAQRARPPALRHLHVALLRVRRRRDAGRADARLRAGIQLSDPRGLRSLGDLTGRILQPSRPRAQAGLDRHPDRRRRDEGRRRRRPRAADRRGR